MSKTNPQRLENLRHLIDEAGGSSNLAKKLGYSNASFLVQMAGPNPMRSITEKTARKFEEQLGLSSGWLDMPHGDQSESKQPVLHEPVASVDEIVDLIKMVGKVLDEENVTLPAVKFADLVAFALVEPQASRKIADMDQIRRVVLLMK